jgi:ribonucleoside-diphosphate reductase alpha chain
MISAVFRRGGDVSFVVEELKAVFDPRGGYWIEGHYVPSLLAALGEIIERHMIDIGFMTDPRREQRKWCPTRAQGGEPEQQDATTRACPKCSQPALIRQEGCDSASCGWQQMRLINAL